MKMHDLDDLFTTAAAQSAAIAPSDGLVARVMADAAREQHRPLTSPKAAPVRVGFWTGLSALFGGGGVLAGLASAAFVGMYLGFAQPVAMLTLTDALIGTRSLYSVDLMPGVDALFAED